MAQEVMDEIRSLIRDNRIVLFMKGSPDGAMCGFSATAVDVLKRFPYSFATVDVLQRPDIRAALPALSDWPTFPQVFVRGELVGGCDIVTQMYESGQLAELLADAFRAA